MGTKKEPNALKDKEKIFNECDQAFGFLCLNLAPALLFHAETLKTPNEVWETLEKLFGKVDELKSHELQNELLSLSPRVFDILEDYFTNFKSLKLQLKECGIDKKEDQLVLSMLSKLHYNRTCQLEFIAIELKNWTLFLA